MYFTGFFSHSCRNRIFLDLVRNKTHACTHSHTLSTKHTSGFCLGAMLPSSHLLNGVSIGATSPGLSFYWWRNHVVSCVCVCVCVCVLCFYVWQQTLPGRGQIMTRSDSAITGRRRITERDGGQRGELLAKPFTVTFPGGNKPFTVSVCNLWPITVCVHKW